MIPPIIAAQNSSPVASVQQNAQAQSMLQSQNAERTVQKEQQHIKESVVNKEEVLYYQQRHDAKEESKNKYQSLYNKNKKFNSENKNENEHTVNRVNFDIKI